MGLEWDPEGDRERSREGRARLWTTVAIVVGLLGFGISKLAKHQQERERDRMFEELSERQAQPGYQTSTYTPSGSTSELGPTSRKVCTRLLTCSGVPEAELATQLDACVTAQTRAATDEFSRGVLIEAYRQVLAACGEIPCDQFANCYMDTLKQAAGAPTTSTPVSPETRARLIPLICAVAGEHPGKVPDLDAADASPQARQLKAELAGLDPAAMADLMKAAIASCAK